MYHPASEPQTHRDPQDTGCNFTVGGHIYLGSHAAVVRVPHPPLLCTHKTMNRNTSASPQLSPSSPLPAHSVGVMELLGVQHLLVHDFLLDRMKGPTGQN